MSSQTVHASDLQKDLHEHPERSGQEEETADLLEAFLERHGLPFESDIGGHGILVKIGAPPYVLLRSDMDALPHGDGARHGCGHDGHMAMLACALVGLRERGASVAALFQPSEETGEGMARCLQDPRLADLDVVAAYAIHNIPGEAMGTVILAPGALASTGVRITFRGRESHAATPQDGQNPYAAMHRIASMVHELAPDDDPYALATLVHMRLGDEAYGTSPGKGVVAFTLRGSDASVATMRKRLVEAASACDVKTRVEDVDPFPETRNDEDALQRVRDAAEEAGLETMLRQDPYPWSEDFGHATQRWGGALVGLGSGMDQPPLHDDDYRFPEALLPMGIRLWEALP